MEGNKICKCCCYEGGWGWGGCRMLDGEKKGRQTNQSLRILVNTFRVILVKDTTQESHDHPQNWQRRWWNRKDPQSQQNVLHDHPSPHRQDASVQNPLGKRRDTLGFLHRKSHRRNTPNSLSKRRNTFNHMPLFQTACFPPAVRLVLEWVCGWQKRMRKRLTKDELWVLKRKGLWEVLCRSHTDHRTGKKKYVPKKILKREVSAL